MPAGVKQSCSTVGFWPTNTFYLPREEPVPLWVFGLLLPQSAVQLQSAAPGPCVIQAGQCFGNCRLWQFYSLSFALHDSTRPGSHAECPVNLISQGRVWSLSPRCVIMLGWRWLPSPLQGWRPLGKVQRGLWCYKVAPISGGEWELIKQSSRRRPNLRSIGTGSGNPAG